MGAELMPRAAIDEIVAHRNAALAGFKAVHDALAEAKAHAQAAAPSQRYFHTPELTIDRSGSRRVPTCDDLLTLARKELDRGIWQHLMAATTFDQLLDAQARNELREQLEKDPPEVTVETALATMGQLYGDRDTIFRRGIANAFSALDSRFKSHDGFKIGSRIVLSAAFTAGELGGHWNHWRRTDETLIDVERAFYVLDGRPAPAHREEAEGGGIVGRTNGVRRARPFGASAYEVETEMFRLRVFKNGNAHLYFKRDDLVRRVNEALARHYGATLGAGHSARAA